MLSSNPSPGRPNWGPDATAEDDPPSPNRCYGGSDWTNLLQYSGAASPAQRGEQQGADLSNAATARTRLEASLPGTCFLTLTMTWGIMAVLGPRRPRAAVGAETGVCVSARN